MVSRLEVLALALAAVSLVGTVAVTVMPQWRVSAHIGADLIVMQSVWEGLWMNCVRQLQVMDCKAHPSVLILPEELQAARGLMVTSVVLAVVAFVVTACGSEVTCGGSSDRAAARTGALAAGGVLFLLAGLSTLVPVCWVAHTIIQTFYSPLASNAQRRELGAALYTGWATAGVTMATGVLVLLRYGQRRRREDEERRDYVTYEHKADRAYLQRAPSSGRSHLQYV